MGNGYSLLNRASITLENPINKQNPVNNIFTGFHWVYYTSLVGDTGFEPVTLCL